MAQDIDKLEKAFDGLQELVKVGEKIMKDQKVDWTDSQYIPELYEAIKKCVEAGKAYKELAEEAKDIDGQEAIKLVSKLFN
jgi:hypothetical protein